MSKQHPIDITLVIASGGIKPFAAFPIVRYLEHIGCRVKTIIGSSGGAIIGGGLSLGLSASDMAQVYMKATDRGLFRQINYLDIASFFGLRFGQEQNLRGFLNPKRLQRQFQNFAGDIDLRDMPIDLYVQLTDFYTGQGELLNQGPAWALTYGSCALYPFFPPIEVEGRVWVDGGFSAELPITEIENISSDPVIALRFPDTKMKMERGFAGSYMHLIAASSRQKEVFQHRWAATSTNLDVFYLNVGFSKWVWMWEVKRLSWIWQTGVEALARNRGPLAEFLGLEADHAYEPDTPWLG